MGHIVPPVRRPVVPQRKIQMSREQRRMEWIGAGAVDDKILAPAVEDVAVRIGEVEGHVNVELLGARLIAERLSQGPADDRKEVLR